MLVVRLLRNLLLVQLRLLLRRCLGFRLKPLVIIVSILGWHLEALFRYGFEGILSLRLRPYMLIICVITHLLESLIWPHMNWLRNISLRRCLNCRWSSLYIFHWHRSRTFFSGSEVFCHDLNLYVCPAAIHRVVKRTKIESSFRGQSTDCLLDFWRQVTPATDLML